MVIQLGKVIAVVIVNMTRKRLYPHKSTYLFALGPYSFNRSKNLFCLTFQYKLKECRPSIYVAQSICIIKVAVSARSHPR